jgi:CHRD domain
LTSRTLPYYFVIAVIITSSPVVSTLQLPQKVIAQSPPSEGAKVLIDDAIQALKSNDTKKAQVHLSILNQQLPRFVNSSSHQSVKVLLDDISHSFVAKLTGNSTIPPVNTNATGIAKFNSKAADNEIDYEINIANIHRDIVKVDLHTGRITENGPTVATLYQSTLFPSSEICCRSAASESERSKFFFNGTISPQSIEFGPLAGSKNISDLVRLFDSGNAYVEVYTFNPRSLSLLGSDAEVRGQVIPLASK